MHTSSQKRETIMSKKREINNNINRPDKDTTKPVTDSTSVVASTRSIGTQTSTDEVNTARDCGTQTLESLRDNIIFQDHLRRLFVLVVAILVVAVGVILGKSSTSAGPQIMTM